jgi:hypothetical protein
VAKRQVNRACTLRGAYVRSLPVQDQGGGLARGPGYFGVGPPDPSRPSSPECLENRFFRGEPCCKVRRRIPVRITVFLLGRGEYSIAETILLTFQDFPNPLDLDRIDSDSDNHAFAPD